MSIRPAAASDLDAVSRYLAGALRGGGPARYRRFLDYTWMPDKPDLGVLLEDGGRIRGFIGAIYADRAIAGAVTSCCNLTSIAVDETHRAQTLQLFGALLARKHLTFTCFSASDRVAKILEFFKFQRCANERVVVAPLSGLPSLRHLAARPRVRVIADPAELDAALARGADAAQRAISRDHAGYRCGRFLLERGDRRCFFVTVRRGRGIRAFADVLHASDPALLLAHLPWIHGPLWRAHGTVLTGIDRRWVAEPPRASFAFTKLRPIYLRSPTVALAQIDALYSELVPMYG
jgi:hypothetical protein